MKVKDAYSLPRIQDTLDCLSGAVWFTSLDLKSGYWQIKMDEASKPLTAFTVGPLGFYRVWQICHLVWLMHLLHSKDWCRVAWVICICKWCIIYLDDIIVFFKTPKEHLQKLRAVFKCLNGSWDWNWNQISANSSKGH